MQPNTATNGPGCGLSEKRLSTLASTIESFPSKPDQSGWLRSQALGLVKPVPVGVPLSRVSFFTVTVEHARSEPVSVGLSRGCGTL